MSKGVKRDSLNELNSLIQRIQSVSMMLVSYKRELQVLDPDGKDRNIVNAEEHVRGAIDNINQSIISLRAAAESEMKGGKV